MHVLCTVTTEHLNIIYPRNMVCLRYIEYIILKLSSACYTMSGIKPFMSLNALKTIYYSYFDTIISYGLPFWGNQLHRLKIFRMQKRIIRITTGCNSMVSCRNLFRRLEILPPVSQYILSLMLFVVTTKSFYFEFRVSY